MKALKKTSNFQRMYFENILVKLLFPYYDEEILKKLQMLININKTLCSRKVPENFLQELFMEESELHLQSILKEIYQHLNDLDLKKELKGPSIMSTHAMLEMVFEIVHL